MSDPITIKLIFNGGASGSGAINLSRNDFTTTAGGRYLSATVASGSRIGPSLFGVLPEGSIKKVTISASTHNPNDVAQVVTGSVVRTEVDLQGQQQAISFGPADELVFILAARTEVVLIVNELSEAEEAAAVDPVVSFIHRISLRKSDGTGFTAAGTTTPTLTWDPNARISVATSIGAGSLPLSSLTRRPYEGVTLRVRVTGCEGQTAQIGVTQAFTGDFFLGQTIARGEWSQPLTLSHDDLLAIESSGLRAGCPAVVADIEVLPARPQTVVAVPSSAVDGSGGSAGVAGEIPLGEWENLSVNHAGVETSASGLVLFTRDHNGNSSNFFQGTGKGNKATMVSSVLDDMPLGELTSLDIQYVNRSTGNTATLNIPYVNLIVNTGSEIKVFVMARQGGDPALDLLALSTIGAPQDHRHILAWNGAKVQVVDLLAGVPFADDFGGATWHDKTYNVSAVLAQYPQARIVRAFPNENGLMRDTIYSGLLINLGDSGYEENSRALIERVRFNQ